MKPIFFQSLTLLALLSALCLGCDDETVNPIDGGNQDGDGATVTDDGQPDAADEDQPDAADQDQPDAGDEAIDAGDEVTDAGDEDTDAADEDTDAGDQDTDAADEDTDAGDPGTDAADEGPPTLEVTLPQAISGALNANPEVYDQVPLRIQVVGQADDVAVTLEQQIYPAADPDADGTWLVDLPISSLSNGEYQLDVLATNQSGAMGLTSADLVVSTTGIQLSDYDQVDVTCTPRIHRYGDKAYLTWTDTWAGVRTVWLREIDGGGRFIGDRVALVDYPEDIVYARTAFGAETIGIHIQQAIPSVWTNTFVMVDFQGNLLAGPVDLVPDGRYGSFGGAVAYDGAGYVVVNRHNAGAGTGQVDWWRINESDGQVTGPVVISDTGGFSPSSFLSISAIGDRSLAGYVREVSGTSKAWLALMQSDGTKLYQELAEAQATSTWHDECRVFANDDQLVAIWSGPISPPPPDQLRGTVTDTSGNLDPNRGAGVIMEEDYCNRDEPFLLPHPERYGLVFWIDDRSKGPNCLDPTGKIQLFAAPVGSDLIVGEPTVFNHAVFYLGRSQLNAAPAGTNALMVWLDIREGDYREQIWLDTAWY